MSPEVLNMDFIFEITSCGGKRKTLARLDCEEEEKHPWDGKHKCAPTRERLLRVQNYTFLSTNCLKILENNCKY